MSINRTKRPITNFIRPWIVVTIACLIYCIVLIASNDGDKLILVTIGKDFAPPELIDNAYSEEGYDGQFIYYIARDPSNAEPYIDEPAYRFQRILLPALGMGLSFGQDALIPWALLAVGLISVGAGTALLEHLLRQYNVSPWYALGYGFSIGVFGAARLSLSEPLAYALVLGGIVLARREQWIWSAILFALAALAKEVTLLFVAGYGLYLLTQKRWQTMLTFGFIAGLPLAIWQLVLLDRLGELGVGSGGALATGFEIIPFGGIIRILTETVPKVSYEVLPYADSLLVPTTEPTFNVGGVIVFIVFILLLTPFVLFPTIWGLKQVWKDLRAKNYSPVIFILLANALIMLFVPFSTYREPLGILRFIVGLQIAVVLFGAEKHSGRILLNSTVWGYTLLFMFAWDFGGG